MTPLLKNDPIELNLLIDNEARTLDKLKSGEAFAAVSMAPHALPGFQAFELGNMEYILVASPDFKRRYFANGINADTLRHAPGVSFDPKDDSHVRFIEKHFGLAAGSYPRHTVRSSEAFVDLAVQGVAYALLSKLQIKDQLESGELVNLLPHKSLQQTLYWHCWVMLRGVYKQVSVEMVKNARLLLD
jgi:LysR family transcriptional regulator (chromosome initiation inhibitor)